MFFFFFSIAGKSRHEISTLVLPKIMMSLEKGERMKSFIDIDTYMCGCYHIYLNAINLVD